MNESLIGQAVNITIIGMLVVFAFLTLLVGMMHLLGACVARLEKYFPQTVPATAQDNALIAVAIAAARKFQGK